MDRGGTVLQRERLPQIDVPSNANAGTTVNPISWPVGSPPPGWPEETREFLPGQGPRWQEDFYLHVASFPLYVVPPEAWAGIVALSGAGFHFAGAPYRVAFSYLEAPGAVPERGFEVVNLDPAEAASLGSRGDPVLAKHLEGLHLVESLGRFVSPEFQHQLQAQPGVPPLERTGTIYAEVLGAPRSVERWSLVNQPELIVLRLLLPGTEITVGSNLPEERLLPLVQMLERIELGSDLFHRMRRAQAASDAAWNARHHGGNEE